MPAAQFDEIIHAPLRLRICGLLRPVDGISFARVRDTLEVSDANLSKHLKVLIERGYVASTRAPAITRGDGRQVVWLSLTNTGRSAFEQHIEALRQIALSPAPPDASQHAEAGAPATTPRHHPPRPHGT